MADSAAAKVEAGRWLDKAARDLAGARLCRSAPDPLLDLAAYHCQQAAEKTFKALLVLAGEALVRTHDLDTLGDKAVARFPALKGRLDAVRHLALGHRHAPPGPGERLGAARDRDRRRLARDRRPLRRGLAPRGPAGRLRLISPRTGPASGSCRPGPGWSRAARPGTRPAPPGA